MKYKLLLLVLSFVLPAEIYSQQAFYIYRNDGVINTFFTESVDSMTYSRIDTAGVLHDDYVTQEVHAVDSLYRIPIELIDSIGFVTPQTVYQPGVKVIEGEMRRHVILADSLTLVFDAATPNSILPQKGDKLVTTETDDVFLMSFIGQVAEVSSTDEGIRVVCEPVELTDVFECYYGTTNGSTQAKKPRGLDDGYYSTNGFKTFAPGKITYPLISDQNFSYAPNDNLSFGMSNLEANISITPEIRYSATLIVKNHYGTNFQLTILGDYGLEETFELAGNIEGEIEKEIFTASLPIPEAFIDIVFDLGVYANASAEISTEQRWTQGYKHVFRWEWNSEKQEMGRNECKLIPVDEAKTHQGKIAMNGSLGIGAFFNVGITPIGCSGFKIGPNEDDLLKLYVQANAGIGIEGSFVPYKKDFEYAKQSTDLYNQIKDQKLDLSISGGLSLNAEFLKYTTGIDLLKLFNIEEPKKELMSLNSVPTFTNTKLITDNNGKLYASTDVSGRVVAPVNLGFALLNMTNKDDKVYSYLQSGYVGPESNLKIEFDNKDVADGFKLYPMVKYMDMDVIAEPLSAIYPELKVTTESGAYLSYDGNKANIYGNVNYSDADMTVGFCISTSENPNIENSVTTTGEFLEDDRFGATVSGLEDDVVYYYCAYAKLDGNIYYGNVRPLATFTGEMTVLQKDWEYNIFNSTITSNVEVTTLSNVNFDKWAVAAFNPETGATGRSKDIINGLCQDLGATIRTYNSDLNSYTADLNIDWKNYVATYPVTYYVRGYLKRQINGEDISNYIYGIGTKVKHIYDKKPYGIFKNLKLLRTELVNEYYENGEKVKEFITYYYFEAETYGGLFLTWDNPNKIYHSDGTSSARYGLGAKLEDGTVSSRGYQFEHYSNRDNQISAWTEGLKCENGEIFMFENSIVENGDVPSVSLGGPFNITNNRTSQSMKPTKCEHRLTSVPYSPKVMKTK